MTDEEVIRGHWLKLPHGWARDFGGTYRVPVRSPRPITSYNPLVTATSAAPVTEFAVEYRYNFLTGEITGEYRDTKITLREPKP